MHIDDEKWLLRFFTLTKEIATWSKDPDRQVGALLVSPDGRSLSPGYNGLAKGIADIPERYVIKELKNSLVIHAEANAILNAKTSVEGWYLFCTYHPCTVCASMIIQAGIAVVVSPMPSEESSRFYNQLEAKAVLKEANIVITTIESN